ncbi:MAG: site-2 protease family protein [Syntrophaceae bacterium]|nr:site-2 protease family protein [Syntrophaceae bacterium]
MGLLQLLVNDPRAFALLAVPLLYAIILHELAHGWVAQRLGDPTAREAGRITLNPLKHLDPVGTLMLFLFGFGWAKPVPVNFAYVHPFRLGLILISSAGIVANLLMAIAALLLLRLLRPEGSLETFFAVMARINIMLAAFNLIPIPPLDGSKILMGFLSERLQMVLARLEPFGFFIIIGLLYLGVLDPVIRFFRRLILLGIALLLA